MWLRDARADGGVQLQQRGEGRGAAWLDAVGTENEAEETKKYIAELEADIVTVDDLISLAESEMGAKIFGAEKAKEVAAHGKEIKAAGAAYCDCPACAAVEKILAKRMKCWHKRRKACGSC